MKINDNTPPEHSTMRLTLDIDRITGDRVATIVDEVHRLSRDRVRLTELRREPVSLELSGPYLGLERLRATMTKDGLRGIHGGWRLTIGTIQRHALPPLRRSRMVLLVDGDEERARHDADALSRADLETCVASSVGTAVALLMRSALPFDAVVVRHHLPGGNGLQVLDSVRPEQRRCSVLVIDDQARPEIARAYRVRGAFRYVPQPKGPLELVGRVHATVLDTQAWRSVEEPTAADADGPPRQLVDPDHGAERLQHVCGLSSLEREVATMMLRGLRDLDIACMLGKSERTAKRHVSKVLEKAGIGNRASLWGVLYQDGLGVSARLPRAAEARHEVSEASHEVFPLAAGSAPVASSRPATPAPLHTSQSAA